MTSDRIHRDRPRFVPVSTYRLQVHGGFPLTAARDVIPYLDRLGVHACYTAPYFTAAPGSLHGYDVCNHNEISPELGGAAAHDAFTRAIASHRMLHVVDFVPNHMGIGTGNNAWWNDVLENGPGSPAAKFFDVDWTPVKAELHAKLLLPILGDQYGRVLERGELRLAFVDGELVLRYFDQELPINPRQAPRVYVLAVDPLTVEMGADHSHLHEFQSIIASLQNMPAYTEQGPERIVERQREKEVARARLARLVSEAPRVGGAIDVAVRQVNGTPGHPRSFDALHELLEAQAYRLSYWRTASHEINYRRFFDVNTLAGLRVEIPEVFEATHQLLANLLRDGNVHAVRVDHPDGLFDPAGYFDRLQALAARVWGIDRGSGSVPPDRPLYVVAEKILSGHEHLPSRWAVHGTTGYNYLNDLNGIFVDISQARRVRRVYAKLTGRAAAFDDVLYESKRLIMDTALASELMVLAHMLDRIGESNRKSRDFTLESLRDVIVEVVACFPVYRTYVDLQGWTPEDRAVLERAIASARRRNPAMESSLFDFFREVVLSREVEGDALPPPQERRGGYMPADAAEAAERRRFAMKLQQYTGPLQAKGLEDTAFYRYNALLSLNEVGGDPSRFGRSADEFHEANARRAADWPLEMLATATHDTKLGEDVRARINVLSEIPDEWSREVSRWMRLNRSHRTIVDGDPAPDRNDEYRFYQTLVGVWPAELTAGRAAGQELVGRLTEYMLKAVREAKVHTSWLTSNQPYEDALARFVERALGGPSSARFLAALLPFRQRVARLGLLNSLAQVALKVVSPGVPDFYQGTDLWDLRLVDPDNRRPVDFDRRARQLDEVDAVLRAAPAERAAAIAQMLADWTDGRIKLLVTAAGLRLRRDMPSVFPAGDYVPLATEVTVRGGVVAFARTSGTDAVVVAAPRLVSSLCDADHPLPLGGDCWRTSRVLLPESLRHRTFRHVLTGAEIRPTTAGDTAWMFLGEIFQTIPVGILRAE
ncbi:MAG: malto-oligosyltrehalose synthase [Acidobacteria bacterium RIFCSPLOWO2_02_FULL_67_36]|nr:MAG: malto-oligosyltrehalose synthase [Acidobacteria bacterium RIFCSPLOWO2_02_FULL_67_36]OFW19008.1 MAG: malto-oligosyltrehalose synthase [Acidobacteria bacterium RIFCSPLOWO2_12_FULL_66_21]